MSIKRILDKEKLHRKELVVFLGCFIEPEDATVLPDWYDLHSKFYLWFVDTEFYLVKVVALWLEGEQQQQSRIKILPFSKSDIVHEASHEGRQLTVIFDNGPLSNNHFIVIWQGKST